MNDSNPVTFFPSKHKLLPVAVNIAIAPLLLYLLRFWPWPPTTLHLGAFVLSTVLAVRYMKWNLTKPRLVFNDVGIHCGKSYESENIEAVKPYMRALKLWINNDGKVSEKVINLWWASKEDMNRIYHLASQRYKVMD